MKFSFIMAVTPLHVGMGRGEGTHVDLPVQRDEFGLPAVWASSLKGAMKSYALTKNPEELVYRLFGGRPGEQLGETSAVTLLDARLFMIPARSLRGVWVYITSPHMLRGFLTYAEIVRPTNRLEDLRKAVQRLLDKFSNLEPGKAVVSTDKVYSNGRLFINEVPYHRSEKSDELSKFMDVLTGVVDLPKTELVLVSDDDIITLVNRSMLIQYRVRLTREKTVEEGALWSEEYVPQFALFYSGLICKQIREFNSAEEVCQKAVDLLARDGDAYMWVGGKETIGKGLVRLRFV